MDDTYERGAKITVAIVAGWTGPEPRFAFPPKEIGLIADLSEIGEKLARNNAARELLALLIKRCRERTGQVPTVIMLQVALDMSGIPTETVPLSDLKLPTPMIPIIPTSRGPRDEWN